MGKIVVIGDCIKCEKVLYEGDVAKHLAHTDVFLCKNCDAKDQSECSKREDRYIGGYFPPPWNPDEHPQKTEGWIEFQEEQRKNLKYYGYGALNISENTV